MACIVIASHCSSGRHTALQGMLDDRQSNAVCSSATVSTMKRNKGVFGLPTLYCALQNRQRRDQGFQNSGIWGGALCNFYPEWRFGGIGIAPRKFSKVNVKYAFLSVLGRLKTIISVQVIPVYYRLVISGLEISGGSNLNFSHAGACVATIGYGNLIKFCSSSFILTAY